MPTPKLTPEAIARRAQALREVAESQRASGPSPAKKKSPVKNPGEPGSIRPSVRSREGEPLRGGVILREGVYCVSELARFLGIDLRTFRDLFFRADDPHKLPYSQQGKRRVVRGDVYYEWCRHHEFPPSARHPDPMEDCD